MRIHVIHSSGFDYENELYKPLRKLRQRHEVFLPHEGEPRSTRELIKRIDPAEVSFPSTGMGVELGWASCYGKRILAIYRKGTKPSSSIKFLTDWMVEYEEGKLLDVVEREIGKMR